MENIVDPNMTMQHYKNDILKKLTSDSYKMYSNECNKNII